MWILNQFLENMAKFRYSWIILDYARKKTYSAWWLTISWKVSGRLLTNVPKKNNNDSSGTFLERKLFWNYLEYHGSNTIYHGYNYLNKSFNNIKNYKKKKKNSILLVLKSWIALYVQAWCVSIVIKHHSDRKPLEGYTKGITWLPIKFLNEINDCFNMQKQQF